MINDPLHLLAEKKSHQHFRMRAILTALLDFSLLRARTLSYLVFFRTENRNYARAEIQDLLRAMRDYGYVDMLAQRYHTEDKRPRRHLYHLTGRGFFIAQSIMAGVPPTGDENETAVLSPAILNVNREKAAMIGAETHEQMVDQLILALHEGARRPEIREKGVRIESIISGPTFERTMKATLGARGFPIRRLPYRPDVAVVLARGDKRFGLLCEVSTGTENLRNTDQGRASEQKKMQILVQYAETPVIRECLRREFQLDDFWALFLAPERRVDSILALLSETVWQNPGGNRWYLKFLGLPFSGVKPESIYQNVCRRYSHALFVKRVPPVVAGFSLLDWLLDAHGRLRGL